MHVDDEECEDRGDEEDGPGVVDGPVFNLHIDEEVDGE